ncbi:two-component system, NtrC family, sensor kinase [Desulfuromusa kysingii]|uniref:histidine kinase n=1 Tax=Desulfuromusa kysingii TaxID=37625 RepID=A0A1H4BDX7_9BACT|nr:ATP-binding protein [Desulfuromusa kysingii]SEA46415.1 two-component system, NtrC family, sensor kinase [Desulfuromusa kysingii]
MRMRISQKVLLAMLGVTIVSLGIFSFLMITSTGQILQQNITGRIQGMAESSVQNLVDLVDRSGRTLHSIAATIDVAAVLAAEENGDPAATVAALQRLETTFLQFQRLDSSLQAIRLVNNAGQEIVKIREGKILPRSGEDIPGLDLKTIGSIEDRSFFQHTMELPEGETWISNLERGWTEGGLYWCPAMVRFSTPLFYSDGRRAGALIINVWGATLGAKINSLITADQGQAFLIERNTTNPERNGIYLFSQDSTCEFGNQTGSHINVFQHYPETITTQWMENDEGVISTPDSRDLLAYTFYSPYNDDSRGWVVVVEAHKKYFMLPLVAIKQQILISTVLVLIFAALVAGFFSRSITRPIQTVIDGTHCISHDLSCRIPLRSHDEIGTLTSEINRMAMNLQSNLEEKERIEEQIHNSEKLASIGEMASGLAHELNTPLGNIRALSSLARQDLQNGTLNQETLGQDFSDIIDQIDKSSKIISGLLSFARRQASEKTLCDINQLVEHSLDLTRIKSTNHNIQISFTPSDNLPLIKIDQNQIQQVFVNILLNAIDAIGHNGFITAATAFHNGQIAIKFSDNGSGIAPENLNRIFDPFFTTKEVGKGTGLGLSVSYGIVKNHGGTIEVDSTIGTGTNFTVFLSAGE